VLIMLGVAARIPLFDFRSDDWNIFLSKWMAVLHQQGLSAFGERFSDYNFPYLFLLWAAGHLPLSPVLALKLLSTSFDAILALAVGALVHELRPNTRGIAAAAVTFCLPTVILNSAAWGQCDALYVALMVYGLLLACRHKTTTAAAVLGVALAVKLQAVFLLPVMLVVWWRRGHPIAAPAVGLVAFMGSSLPPVLWGRSLPSVLSTYSQQTQEYSALTSNAPNLYQWWPRVDPTAGERFGLAISLLTVTALLGLARLRPPDTPQRLLAFAAVVLCSIPFVLPRMHERYFFAAEVTTVAMSFCYSRAWPLAAALQTTSTLAYLPFLERRTPVPLAIDAIGVLVVIGVATAIYIRRPRLVAPRESGRRREEPACA